MAGYGGRGPEWSGQERNGEAVEARRGTSGLDGRGMTRQGVAGIGEFWRGGHVVVMSGVAWHGLSRRGGLGEFGLGVACEGPMLRAFTCRPL